MKRLALLFIIQFFALAAVYASPAKLGQHFTIESTHLKQSRKIVVSVPEYYDSEPHQHYPVLYVTDAAAQFDHLSSTINYIAGTVSPMIVVGIYQQDRRDEMMAFDQQSQPRQKSQRFLKFITDEVKPFIKEKFRTVDHSLLAGHSIGGAFTLHAYLTQPQEFDVFLALSPSLAWGNEQMLELLPAHLNRSGQPTLHVYFEGITPFPTPAKSYKALSAMFANAKEQNKLAIELRNDEDHISITHYGVYTSLKAIYHDWFLYIPEIVKNKTAFTSHFSNLSQRLGFNVKPSEYYIRGLVGAMLDQNQIDTAQYIASEAVKLYPNSHQSFERLAEVATAKQQTSTARKHLNQALQLASTDEVKVRIKESISEL
ncbi:MULTISPECIES: alpha/beta hydrolase-fold protein [unclassified Pseudoalteromonas]|uniref:alpha/beta hydrolase-fold protein n=1 Tax=unclassified Pseudoalteromonas TaxID=194690 RepID=UPI003015709F